MTTEATLVEVPAPPAPLPHPTHVDPVSPHGELVTDVGTLLTELSEGTRSELDGELGVRALLIQLRQNAAERERIGRLKEAVVTPYDVKLEGLSVMDKRIREVLDDYLRRQDAKGAGSKVSVPDAGTTYLSTKNAGGKARVTDAAELVAWLEELTALPESQGGAITEAELRELYVEQLDKAAALELVLERFVAPTKDGHLVRKDTGEFLEVPGIEVTPEERTVAVRLA
jgi:hypothetical protein